MRYAIIGGSAAGISCIESIRRFDKKSAITLVGEESFKLYSRCLLSYFLAGDIGESKLYFKDTDFFESNNVEAILGVRAEAIDKKARKILLRNKKTIDFDRLLIAAGARSRMLDIPGIDSKGVYALRTIEDARGIEGMLKTARSAVVLGGGLIGLKAAYAINARGVSVKVVVKSGQVLSQILDAKAASLVQAKIQEKGIAVMKGLEASQIIGKGAVEGVLLDDGSALECQIVIIGKGVEPNIELAKAAGIDSRKGIVTNDYLQTSADGIFAAGDVAETRDIASGKSALNAIWPCAVEQGKIAGKNMADVKTKYDGSLAMNSIEFFGLPVISMGLTRPPSDEYEELTAYDERKALYKKVILKDNVIRGYAAAGAIENAGVYNILIRSEVNAGKIKGALLDSNFNYAKAMPLIKEYKEKFDKEEFKDSIITY